MDRNEIAVGLGVSRVPIQEALVQLEHDGIVSTRYHRGAFVERFDEATVLEHHELEGLLNGIASARAGYQPDAADPGPTRRAHVIVALREGSTGLFRNRRGISPHDQRRVRGPRLHATIRASQNLIPHVFWMTYQGGRVDMWPFYEEPDLRNTPA